MTLVHSVKPRPHQVSFSGMGWNCGRTCARTMARRSNRAVRRRAVSFNSDRFSKASFTPTFQKDFQALAGIAAPWVRPNVEEALQPLGALGRVSNLACEPSG